MIDWDNTTCEQQPSLLCLYFYLVYQPSKPDKTAADPKSWLALECDATEKKSATGAYAQEVPYAVYSLSNFAFMKTELESGWFAIKMEDDDKDDYGQKKLTKVCFLVYRKSITIQEQR